MKVVGCRMGQEDYVLEGLPLANNIKSCRLKYRDLRLAM